MKRNPMREALADSAQRLIAELLAALEHSTRGLIADSAAEQTPERDRWTRKVLQRIKMLSGLTTSVDDESPATAPENYSRSTSTAPNRPMTAKPSTPATSVDSSPTASAATSRTNQKCRAQIRQEKREAAKAAKEQRKNFDRILRASKIAFPSFERLSAAVPDLDPIRQLQEVKDRGFSSG